MSTMTPEDRRRLHNVAKFWNERLAGAESDADLVRICFDRAKAAARRAQRSGNARAMHELAELLATWAEQQERAEVNRRARHSA
ncbi:hypothetical protein [Planomonospora sp. ID82291]|uniref:hypothetical protein n=1 Tax=Planomonospora sp. ID82291 TaxID=2738136 RepID=UPI0018C39D46|nr:hypothetical protein [Planomonospora sp. ID82291]MBG0819089.1 hypothetical protein [Planomonospora sp. ID82291]